MSRVMKVSPIVIVKTSVHENFAILGGQKFPTVFKLSELAIMIPVHRHQIIPGVFGSYDS